MGSVGGALALLAVVAVAVRFERARRAGRSALRPPDLHVVLAGQQRGSARAVQRASACCCMHTHSLSCCAQASTRGSVIHQLGAGRQMGAVMTGLDFPLLPQLPPSADLLKDHKMPFGPGLSTGTQLPA